MAPEFPYDKRHDQPPGLMVIGAEKTYIGIRANASGHFRYTDIFQNYAQEILKLSYRNLPPWLEEGFSTVYGNVTFNDRGVRLERPDPDDLSVLSESPLLPLDLVLHVDHSSPYYSPGNKASVYFAESRVLVHFLISDPQFAGTKAMERYVTAVQSGADSVKAARDAFGDLNQLQAKLDAFVKNVSGAPADLACRRRERFRHRSPHAYRAGNRSAHGGFPGSPRKERRRAGQAGGSPDERTLACRGGTEPGLHPVEKR